jgi:hypothetical protein
LTRSGLKPIHAWVENANLYATDAVEIWLVTDDKVLVRQECENKMSTSFNPTRFQIVEKNDKSVLVESEQGVQYKWNVIQILAIMFRFYCSQIFKSLGFPNFRFWVVYLMTVIPETRHVH